MSDQIDLRPILGAGLNQVQALRDAVCWTLGGRPLLDLKVDSVAEWLRKEGLAAPADIPHPNQAVSMINAAVENHRRGAMGQLALPADALSSSLCNPDSKIIGRTRSGTAWNEGAAFCITSAFVRLLGASEQFELDVLKALLHYRPAGTAPGKEDEHPVIAVEIDVLREKPRIFGDVAYYEKPAIWTWIKRHAEGNDERRKIFARVFELELTPGESDAERKVANKVRGEWYEKRNMIAHGRESVVMTLAEYLNADVFVIKSMLHLARQCQDRQKLVI